jgi:hypothetical protein
MVVIHCYSQSSLLIKVRNTRLRIFLAPILNFVLFHCWFCLNANYNKQQLENWQRLAAQQPYLSKPPLQASITKKACPLAPLLLLL